MHSTLLTYSCRYGFRSRQGAVMGALKTAVIAVGAIVAVAASPIILSIAFTFGMGNIVKDILLYKMNPVSATLGKLELGTFVNVRMGLMLLNAAVYELQYGSVSILGVLAFEEQVDR